ncbi:snRNA-activating protein complex subunit 1 [Hyperolius riggenbachi]|uniref:snRNA-activating protein complex subunit 1 n=1 Tax=Hyperolius riggenbachi TaxID=752182 RepID=UPI0035A2B404
MIPDSTTFLGIKEDCETLLSRFQATDSVRYEVFLSIWKAMKFHSIFFGGMRNLESNRFSRELLSVASAYFLPPYTFQIRVGALYLLYGLYNTQLCQPKQKIRMSLKDWPEVERFCQDLVSAEHLDALYVYRQLHRYRAFHFTAMPSVLTFRAQMTIPTEESNEEFKDVRNRVSDLIPTDTLEEIANIHEHYQKTKRLVPAAEKSLSLIKDQFADNLDSLVTEHQRWKQEKLALRVQSEEEKEGTSQESEGSERARVLAEIKSKTYTSVTQAVKSRRHRQVHLASSDSGSEKVNTQAENNKQNNQKRRATKEAQKQTYLKLTMKKKKKTANMPTISEETSSSSSEEIPVPKKKRKR